MSNLIFNLRVLFWHIQISKDRKWQPFITFNRYHWERGFVRPYVQRYE